MKKIIIATLMVIMGMFIFAGCGGSPKISIDDLKYSIEEGIVNGDRMPTFSCENNSKYDIVSMNVDYKIKDGTSNDALSANSEIQKISQNKSHDVSETTMNVISDYYIAAGDKQENIPISLDKTYTRVKNMDTVNVMEPDILTIAYLDGGKIYTAYYDFKNEKMTYEEESKEAKTWSEKELAKTIPEPDAKVILVTSDEDEYFRAIACHYSKDEYNKYIEKCKEKGYTVDQDTYESTQYSRYTAEDKNGNLIEVYLTEEGNLDLDITKK